MKIFHVVPPVSPESRKIPKYRMKVDSSLEHRATTGTIVYRCIQSDYGTADDDSIMFGHPHISVTLDPTGDYPFFTIAERDVERLEE